MKQKLLLTFALLLTAVTGAWAESWPSGACTVTLEGNILTVSGSGAMADYVNDELRPWHSNVGNITSIVIDDGVTGIGYNAFMGCNNASLASVTIPASVTSIGFAAFQLCTMPSVTFASGSQLTSIGGYAFEECPNLTSFTIPNGVTTIGYSAFMACEKMASVTIPASVTTIDDDAFIVCTALATVTFAAGSQLTTIGEGAFYGCNNESLTSITLPASVTSIGNTAFQGCENLATVTLNSNPTIGADAFKDIKEDATVTMNLTANSADEKYWMTFYNKNYNFQADANTQVFKAALSGTKVSLTELTTDKIVNKDNAVLLKSTASPIVMTLTSTNSENVFTGNALNGVSDPAGKTDDGKMYVLNYTAANGVGFYKLATGSKLGVGKAYLSYSGGGASNFFGLDDDGTTSIDVRSKMEEVRGDGLYYDLNGRRIMNPTKGIYIVNGKKIVIK